MMNLQDGSHPLISTQLKADISKYIATKQIKGGILKGIDLVKKKGKIELSKPIGPPDKLAEPFDNEELKLVAERLYDLGYYYEKNPEKEEIEYSIAPNYLGIIGMASDKEQNSLQAAIKKFQRVHGFSLDECNGCIDTDEKTLKKLNSKMSIPLKSYSSGITKVVERFYEFEDNDHNHLHPILLDFMDDIHWFFNKWMKSFKVAKATGKIKGKYSKEVKQIFNSNLTKNVVISYASKGYPGDGHKDPRSDYYKGKAIDIIAINEVNVRDFRKESAPLPWFNDIPPQFRQIAMANEYFKFFEGLFAGPVKAFATVLNVFKQYESDLPFRWRLAQLDTPWHGNKQNHQEYIHISVESKMSIG